MYYFKLQKLEFKQLIDDIAIDLCLSLKSCKHRKYMKIM